MTTKDYRVTEYVWEGPRGGIERRRWAVVDPDGIPLFVRSRKQAERIAAELNNRMGVKQ